MFCRCGRSSHHRSSDITHHEASILPPRARVSDSEHRFVLSAAGVLAPAAPGVRTAFRPGRRSTASKCASCHGAAGEGSKEYAKPLVGEKSIGQLARLVEKTMPEDDPGRASARKPGACRRTSTSRSTRGPRRSGTARLASSCRADGAAISQHGRRPGRVVSPAGHLVGRDRAEGQYYKSRQIGRKDDLVFEPGRSRGPVRFRGRGSSAREVRPGAVLDRLERVGLRRRHRGLRVHRPDRSGDPAVRQRPEATVDRRFGRLGRPVRAAGSLFLIGGRAYPISLEFSKAKQGVDDSKDPKKKFPDKKASVSLSWKPPGQVEQVIPARHLARESSPSRSSRRPPFPPDDRSVGYERGSTISKAWDAAVTESAIEVSATSASISANSPTSRRMTRTAPTNSGRSAGSSPSGRFVARSTAEQVERYVTRPFAESKSSRSPSGGRSLPWSSRRISFIARSTARTASASRRGSPTALGCAPRRPLLEAAAEGQLQTASRLSLRPSGC